MKRAATRRRLHKKFTGVAREKSTSAGVGMRYVEASRSSATKHVRFFSSLLAAEIGLSHEIITGQIAGRAAKNHLACLEHVTTMRDRQGHRGILLDQ